MVCQSLFLVQTKDMPFKERKTDSKFFIILILNILKHFDEFVKPELTKLTSYAQELDLVVIIESVYLLSMTKTNSMFSFDLDNLP